MAEIRWSVSISKFQRIFYVSFSWKNSELCIYHFFIWSNLNFLHNAQWKKNPHSVIYSFYANLLHLFIMILIVSSQSPYVAIVVFVQIISIVIDVVHSSVVDDVTVTVDGIMLVIWAVGWDHCQKLLLQTHIEVLCLTRQL